MVLPMYFIIDMGKQAAYSRLRIWMRNRAPLFSGPIMTRFEIWGTNSPKPLDEIGDGSKEANLRYWTGWPEGGGTKEWRSEERRVGKEGVSAGRSRWAPDLKKKKKK